MARERILDERPEDIEFKLRHIRDHFDELPDSSQEWAMKMEEAYEQWGRLSPRQMEVLNSIWEEVE